MIVLADEVQAVVAHALTAWPVVALTKINQNNGAFLLKIKCKF